MSGRPQFSIAALLSTVSGVAVVLWLMLRISPEVGTRVLLVLTLASLAFACVASLHGPDGSRPFCIGVAIPLVDSLAEASFSGIILNIPIEGIPIFSGTSVASQNRTSIALGSAILMGIALGYLCVGFRWLIEPRAENRR